MADNDPKEPKKIRAVVAKGRTVVVGKKTFSSGEEITLPEDEVIELRAKGFLVDPNAPEIPRGDGPDFKQQGAPSVRAA